MSFEEKVKELNLEIPEPPTPVASYVPGVLSDGYIYTSGQLPVVNGELKHKGQVGLNISEEEAYKAAEICALNCLGVIKSLVGSLDKVEKIIKITGFVNSAPNYTQQPKIACLSYKLSNMVRAFRPGNHKLP